MPLMKCPDCGIDVSTAAIACPKCGHPFQLAAGNTSTVGQSATTLTASIKKGSSFAGGGCALQALGLVSLVLAIGTVFTVVGPIFFGGLGIWLLVYGSKKSNWLECTACGGRIASNSVKVCPHCKARFK